MRYASASPILKAPRARAAPARRAPRAALRPAALGNQALLRRLQAKLTVGAVNDPLEREADTVADQVMRMPDPASVLNTSPPRISRKCAACESEETLRTKRNGTDTAEAEAPATVDNVLRSPGEPLDAGAREFFEPRFGADFSAVRVHRDDRAAQSAQDVGARAYTVGKDLVFAPNAYAPTEDAGRRLIAHELSHVVQQGESRAAGIQRDMPSPPASGTPAPGAPAPPASGTPAPPAPTGPQPAKPPCLPLILNPTWNVGPPALDTKGQWSPCGLHASMNFNGTVSLPTTCPGSVYFVQYAKPSRSFVICFGAKEEGECVKPALGVDTAWPYPFGSKVNTDQDPGSSVPLKGEDVPGVKNLSNPALETVRFCMDDAFTTYIVFEDRAKTLTSLGWMSWSVTAHAERDGGTCPRKTTTPDCAGWTVTAAAASKVGSNFSAGAMAPQQALDRTVALVNMSFADCDPSACPKAAAPSPTPGAPSPAPSAPSPAPSTPAPAPSAPSPAPGK